MLAAVYLRASEAWRELLVAVLLISGKFFIVLVLAALTLLAFSWAWSVVSDEPGGQGDEP